MHRASKSETAGRKPWRAKSRWLLCLTVASLIASLLTVAGTPNAAAAAPPDAKCIITGKLVDQVIRSSTTKKVILNYRMYCRDITSDTDNTVGMSLIKWNGSTDTSVACWPNPTQQGKEKVCDVHLGSPNLAPGQALSLNHTVTIITGRTNTCQSHTEHFSGTLYAPKVRQKPSVDVSIVSPKGMVKYLKIGGWPVSVTFCAGDTAIKPPPASAASVEFRKQRVRSIFQNFLGRSPEASALNHFASRNCTIDGQRHMALSLVDVAIANRELEKRIGYPNDPNWKREGVTRVYKGLLGRNPDASGFNFWMNNVYKIEHLNKMARDVSAMTEFTQATIRGCGIPTDGPVQNFLPATNSVAWPSVPSQPSAPSQPTTNGSAFILKQGTGAHWWISNGKREWISPTCATSLTQKGTKIQNANWTQISTYPKQDILGCPNASSGNQTTPAATATPTVPSQPSAPSQPTTNGSAFILKQGTGAHWWISNGKREWISPTCATSLTQKGTKIQNANWTQISTYPKQDILGCPK